MSGLKMPARKPTDGGVRVERNRETEEVTIAADGVGALTVSEHNAWRLFGALAMMLEIPLPPRVGKAIKF